MAENTNNTQNAGAATQQAQKTKRDLALERLKIRHPDTDYADDEAIYGAINDDYDEDQKALEGYKANEKAMSDMMTADPRSAAFLQAMFQSTHPHRVRLTLRLSYHRHHSFNPRTHIGCD